MFAYMLLAFVVLIGPLAVLYGRDSRPVGKRDERGWWPGRPGPR